MAWLQLDDNFVDHPKIAGLSDKAFRLHVCALAYINRQLTDGRIPASFTKPTRVTRELEDANAWHKNGDGWTVHDWIDWNQSRAVVQARREAAASAKATAGSLGNHRRWHVARGVRVPGCTWCDDP